MCHKKEAAQAVKRLMKEGLVIALEVGTRHYRLTLCNGMHYTRASSPSDWRAVRNMVSDIRRLTRV